MGLRTSLAVTCLVGAVVIGVIWTQARPVESAVPPAEPSAVAGADLSSAGPRALQAPRLAVETPPRQSVATVSSGASALIAEQIELQRLAADVEIALSADQWATLAATTSHLQAVRASFEASIGRLGQLHDGGYRLEIPPYPDAGAALRAELFQELRRGLGAETAQLIEQRLGRVLESHFAGFGLSAQTLDFISSGGGESAADYQVTRTSHYASSITGQERLLTRRQCHFPAIEDPTGHVWGPYLALVARELTGNS